MDSIQKERPDSRDVLVLLTMAFAFGAFFSWALFYRPGSLPPLKAVDPAAWLQAIGSLIAIVVAIGVPTFLYISERDRQRAKELNKAKCVFAFVQNDLHTTVLMLGHTKWMVQQGQFASSIKEAEAWDAHTRIPDSLVEAMRAAHEFPALIDGLIEFYFQMNHTNAFARYFATSAESVHPTQLEPLRKDADYTLELGSKLQDSVSKLFGV
ncbi:hypothetical protein [Stenotrophomonas maltophilia]|uniref:hypothetical protein n=1 Tax=Stenotrophomonas maltophilia TaxID=40324 RepID=UPI00066D7A5B|nr:hypothetical protein [Stenotrophomonas maltophilia]MBH1667471.1 hypothetical protein [Stenotrophomonas maltophilia]HBC50703.1 hypothetical protein [Stenotrophomonas maltophilia]